MEKDEILSSNPTIYISKHRSHSGESPDNDLSFLNASDMNYSHKCPHSERTRMDPFFEHSLYSSRFDFTPYWVLSLIPYLLPYKIYTYFSRPLSVWPPIINCGRLAKYHCPYSHRSLYHTYGRKGILFKTHGSIRFKIDLFRLIFLFS